MAKLVLARRARLEMLELDWPLIDAIEYALGLLEREPRAGHALRGRLRGLHSLRVGSFRILYQLTEGEQTVRVATIRHRAVAYGLPPSVIALSLTEAILANRENGAGGII